MTTPVPSDPDRYYAAQLALQAAGPAPSQQVLRRWLSFFDLWLSTGATGPLASIVINITIRNRKTGDTVFDETTLGGAPMAAVSMTIDDTITLAASEVDDHQDPVTSDALALSASDNGSVLTWVQSGNTWTGTPVAEGTAQASVSDPSAPNLAAGVTDITVGPGAPSAIAVQATVNTGANTAPPPAGP